MTFQVFNSHLDLVEIINRTMVMFAWLAAAWIQRWSANHGPVDWRPIRVAVGALSLICAFAQAVLLFTDIDPRSWSIVAVGLNYPVIVVAVVGNAIHSVAQWRAFKADIGRLERGSVDAS